MNNLLAPFWPLCLATCLALSTSAHATSVAVPTAPNIDAIKQRINVASAPFVPNAGQWDARAAFAAKTFAGTLFVTTDGKLVYSLPAASPSAASTASAVSAGRDAQTQRALALTESFVSDTGETRVATPHGYRPAESKVSYLIGNDARKHQANLNTYDRVNLGDVFPGVNVQLRATGTNVEKIFTVAPAQDPSQIHVKIDGAVSVAIGAQGELIAHTENGPVTYTAPIAFQETADGSKHPVTVSYALDAATHTYGFTLGDYDPRQPLIIDPMLQSAYLGGSGSDNGFAIAVHPRTGEIYVTGGTFSSNLPLPAGYDATLGGTSDAFVSLFSADLKTLYRTTYIGGSGTESGTAIAVHPSNFEVYVSGKTTSTDFPLTPGFVDQPASGGGTDVFVTRLSSSLSAMRLSSYLGGAGSDELTAMAIHPNTGDIYLAGHTDSANFPTTTTALQTASGGGIDSFLARVSQDFSPSTFSRVVTRLGGAGNDYAYALLIHPQSGDVYIGGTTSSNNLPGINSGSAQSTKTATFAGFVSRINRDLTGGLMSTYLTGGADDTVYALAFDRASGTIIAAGESFKAAGAQTLPGTAGTAQPAHAGAIDAFITRLSPTLTSIPQSTYLGGTSNETAYAVAVHPVSGEIFLAGATSSTAFTTPVDAGAIQPSQAGSDDMFVARFSADLTVRAQATYLGTSVLEQARAIAFNAAGTEVLLAGLALGAGFPGTATGAPTVYGGANDAILVRLSTDLTAVNRAPQAMVYIPQSNVPPGTQRTSNEARMVITPAPATNQSVYLSGQPGEMCVTNRPGCCTLADPNLECAAQGGYATGWFPGPWDSLSGDYIAVRHYAAFPAGSAVTNVITGGSAFPFVTSTGNARIRCSLDANGDGLLQANREGLILLRAMLGIRGNAVVAGTGVSDWLAYRDQLNAHCGTAFQ